MEPDTAVDHAAAISKLKQLNPDVIYMIAVARQAGTFKKQARTLGLNTQVATYGGLQEGGFFDLSGPSADGMLETQVDVELSASNPIATQYKAAFAAVCPKADATNTYSILAHDATLIIQDAIKYLDQHDLAYNGANLREAVATTKSFQVAGGTTVFNSDGSSTAPIILAKVENEKFVPFQTVKTDHVTPTVSGASWMRPTPHRCVTGEPRFGSMESCWYCKRSSMD